MQVILRKGNNMRKKRIIAALMAAVMCLTAVSCSNSDQPPVSETDIGERWQISEEEAQQAAQLSCNTAKNGDTLEITLTSDEDLFKEGIEKSDIVVQAFEYKPIEQTDEENVGALSTDLSEAGAEASADEPQQNEPESSLADPITITDYTLSRTDARTLTITFKDSYEYGVYDFYIHKDGASNGRYAWGTYINLPENESAVQNPVSALVEGIFYNGDENPVLKVTLENTAVTDVKPENIELLGAFEDLSIASVTATDTEITLNTVGEIHICSAPYGYVDISPEALSAENEVIATVEISQAGAYISPDSYAYENGNLKFDLELSGAKAEKNGEELADLITVGGNSVASAAANTEGNVITVTVPTNGADIDSAINSVVEKPVVIRKEALSCDIDIEYTITDNSAYISAYTDYIEKADSGYKCTLYLVPIYGSLADLTAADLTFDGDFEGAKVTDVKQEGSLYTVTFTFTGDKSLDNSIFEGSIKVADGKLINAWGTPSEYTHETFGYMAETVRGDKSTIKEVINTLSEAKNTFETIRDLAKTFEKLAKSAYSLDYDGFVGSAEKILTSFGIIDRAPDKMDKIYSAVLSVKNDIKNLDSKIENVKKSLKQELEYIQAGIDKQLYISSSDAWNTFCSSYIKPLQSRLNSVSNDTRAYIVDLVQYGNEDGKISVVYDTKGSLTIANKDKSEYSVENVKIDKEKTLYLEIDENSFPNALNALYKNENASDKEDDEQLDFEAELEKDIKNLIIAQGLAQDDESVTKLTKEFYASITTNAMYNALTKYPQTLNDIENDFVEFCKRLKGEDTATSPLIYRYYNIYANFNFQYEAEECLTEFNDYLKALTIQYGTFATLSASYNRGYDRKNNPVAAQIKSTLEFLEKNNGMHEVPNDNYQWCYVVDRPIKMHIVNFAVANTHVFFNDVQYSGYKYCGYSKVNKDPVCEKMMTMKNTDDGVEYIVRVGKGHKSFDSDFYNKKRLTASDLNKIRVRYMRLGNDPNKFFDYMTSEYLFKTGEDPDVGETLYGKNLKYYNDRKFIDKKFYVLTDYIGKETFDVNNKKELYATDNYSHHSKVTDMLQPGKKYYVPTETDPKAKYYEFCNQYMGSVYNLYTGAENSKVALLSEALYGHSSMWWKNDNWMEFRNSIYDEDNSSARFIEYEVY